LPDATDSDEGLVQATGRGDLKSFEQIVKRHQSWVWRIAYRFIGNENDCLKRRLRIPFFGGSGSASPNRRQM
jgi:hypothetical protein